MAPNFKRAGPEVGQSPRRENTLNTGRWQELGFAGSVEQNAFFKNEGKKPFVFSASMANPSLNLSPARPARPISEGKCLTAFLRNEANKFFLINKGA